MNEELFCLCKDLRTFYMCKNPFVNGMFLLFAEGASVCGNTSSDAIQKV